MQARRLSDTPTTYAVFPCTPHVCASISRDEVLVIRFASGSVEAFSTIEEPWKPKCPGERDGAVSRHLRASGEDEFLSVVVLCRDSACCQLVFLSPLLRGRHPLSLLLEYGYFYGSVALWRGRRDYVIRYNMSCSSSLRDSWMPGSVCVRSRNYGTEDIT